jgi:hypothetical protein
VTHETFPTGNDSSEAPRTDERAAGQERALGIGAEDSDEAASAGTDAVAAERGATEGDAESGGLVSDPDAAPEGMATPDPYEGAVPPGYDWPTHGGYLGCLLGLMAACIAGGFLGSLVVGLVSVSPLGMVVGTPAVRITLILGIFVATMVALGRVGWVLGRRFYREYPQPGSQRAGATAVTRGSVAEANREAQQKS